MASRGKRPNGGPGKSVETLTHEEAKRKNIPTAEFQSVVQKETQDPLRVAYERRNKDLDPQLVWRGKDTQDWSDFVVNVPPLYIQEKVHPKALIDDLLRETRESQHEAGQITADLFADFNGIPKGVDKTEFYKHDQNWTNRMILGDSLQVMASLAEREGLRGKVQCIYFDPPYGIKFNSNFQWSTTNRDVKDGNTGHITREPEQVKAFRDTWRDGIHSYLTYLRDRLTVARELLTDTGSIFVQISDENVHRVRSLLEEVFGDDNFVALIAFAKTSAFTSSTLSSTYDYLLWFAKRRDALKYRPLWRPRAERTEGGTYNSIEFSDGTSRRLTAGEIRGQVELPLGRRFRPDTIVSPGASSAGTAPINFQGREYLPSPGSHWKTGHVGMRNLALAGRVVSSGARLGYKRYESDFPWMPFDNVWSDTIIGTFTEKLYVVQTPELAIERCLLMATDPGDLILDPTCGAGTSAYIAERWGRRWITVDTSRVALALARARVMGSRFPYFLLADSPEGKIKEAVLTHSATSTARTSHDVRHGFVYERASHITLGSIAKNTTIQVIWDKWQAIIEPLREKLNSAVKKFWQEWEIPREADPKWTDATKKLHADWWDARIARQTEIGAAIAAKADFEYLYDKPYSDPKKVRVAGPFTVESVSPHRTLGIDENDELIDPAEPRRVGANSKTFAQMILENLKAAGVQQAHKEDRIVFSSIVPWPGTLICGEGRYREADAETGPEKRAAIFIGPEFGTVSRPDLVAAAKEAGDADFDVLIACAFNYEAHATEFSKLGRIPVLKARMNADLHMSDELKNTGKGNLFVIFGEPDIDVVTEKDGRIRVKVNGVDVFDPSSGEVRSDGADGIACWFIDSDYNEESFFVRQAYFLGANDPYGALKTTLRAEINEEAWDTLHSDTSRPFPKPKSGRIAVKVINHLGDEVMKVFQT